MDSILRLGGPWRTWQPTPLLCLEKSGQGTLAGYGPQAHKRVGYSTQQLSFYALLIGRCHYYYYLHSEAVMGTSPLSFIANLDLQALPPYCIAIL